MGRRCALAQPDEQKTPKERRPMGFQLAGMRDGTPPWDAGAMLRCLIVDDSPRFLDAARGLLERQGITVVGVASTSAEALARAGCGRT
jgi:hypothetical protein